MTSNSIRLAAIAVALAAPLALSPLAGAQAQPFRSGEATLYELPDFQGRSVTITQSTSDLGRWQFNDRAQSARFEGRWLACEHGDFRGRCQEISGPVRDLTTYGLFGQISSLQPVGGRDDMRPGPGPGYPPPGYPGRDRPGREARGVEGATTVFFARPTRGGLDLAAGDRAANQFCREQGLGAAAWFDSSTRAPQAVGPEGQVVRGSTVLRDVLCRKF